MTINDQCQTCGALMTRLYEDVYTCSECGGRVDFRPLGKDEDKDERSETPDFFMLY